MKIKNYNLVLQKVEEITQVGLWEFDLKKKLISTSKGARRICGLDSNQEVLSIAHFQTLLIEEPRTEVDEIINNFILRKTPINIEFKLKHQTDDVIKLFSSSLEFIKKENIIFGVIKDITEQRKIETNLKRLSAAVDQNTNAIIITEPDGNIEYVNQRFTELTGYSVKDVTGKNPRILKSGIQQKEFYKKLWQTVSTGQIWKGELYNQKKNGEIYHEEATIIPIKDKRGEITNFLALKEDITSIKRIETELTKQNKELIIAKKEIEESNERYRSLFEYSPVSIWEEDFSDAKKYLDSLKEKGVIDFNVYFKKNPNEILKVSDLIKINNINQETLNMFGVKTKEEIPLNLPKYFNQESLKVFTEEIISFINGETTFESEIPIKSLSREDLILDIKASIVPGYENNWKKVLVSFIDITKRKKAEQALKDREISLRESNSMKDKLFSIISHDLRSPFGVLIGFSELLIKKQERLTEKERNNYINYIHDSAKATHKLLEDLLTWSRSQSSQIKIKPESINTSSFIDEVIYSVKNNALKKEIKIISKTPPDLFVTLDLNTIRTVLYNLIGNAIKFTQRNGVINIEVLQKEKENNPHIEISIKDNGIGMSQEKIKSLFKVESNNSTKGTENESGTGLGLLICKEFVEMNNGKIHVESEPGKGSSFSILLPV